MQTPAETEDRRLRLSQAIPCAFIVLLTAVAAQADTSTFIFDQDACTGTCGTSPFATLTLTESGTGASETVTVTETLGASERYAGTGAGEALEFNISGPITITGLSSDFAIGPYPASASAFGSFAYSIDCPSCQGGKAGNPTGPLSFTVGSATGVSIADFVDNSGGFFFASDIVGNNGNTGNVAAKAGTTISATPEPATAALMLSGLLLAGCLRKKIFG